MLKTHPHSWARLELGEARKNWVFCVCFSLFGSYISLKFNLGVPRWPHVLRIPWVFLSGFRDLKYGSKLLRLDFEVDG